MTPQVVVLDYGMGNRRSVQKALEHVGASVAVTNNLELLQRADGVVIPGVGAFPEAMSRLQALGLVNPLRDVAGQGVPILGICLGMQLLFEGSEEIQPTEGLALLPGRVTWLQTTERLPHIGWNEVSFRHPSTLTVGLPSAGCPFYHVHSLAPRPERGGDIVGSTTYGETFATIVEHDRVAGVQFHPEKSSAHGLRLLANYVGRCADFSAGRIGLATPA